jgi:hypothetical protein
MPRDVTGANLPDMHVGAIRLKDVGDPLVAHGKEVHSAFERYPNIGGNGPIGKAFNESYYPAAKASAKFLSGLSELLDVNGDKAIDLTHLFDDMNDAATDQVSGVDPIDPNVVGPHHV